jgi:lysophospholipase L1-like esterase
VARAPADTDELRDRAMRYLLARMQASAAAAGATLIVVKIPRLGRSAEGRSIEALMPAGATLVDLGQAIRDHHADPSAAPLYLSESDEHPSAAGQALIADRLAPLVAASLAAGAPTAPSPRP